MGLRFQRRIPLIPKLLHLNVSKTGLSLSLGRPGATVNVRGEQVRGTVGVPGTGLSYRGAPGQRWVVLAALLVLLVLALLGI